MVAADDYRFGADTGRLLIRTYRTGLGSRAGHDLTIEATVWQGTAQIGADAGASSVALTVDADSFEVREGRRGFKPLTAADRAGIRKTIRELLDTARYPAITFGSTALRGAQRDLLVDGQLTIRDATHPVMVRGSIEESSGDPRLRATAQVVQSQWGIKPYSAFLGALKLRDAVDIDVEATPRTDRAIRLEGPTSRRLATAARHRSYVDTRCLTALVSVPASRASSAPAHVRRAWQVLFLMVVVGIPAGIVAGLLAGWGYAPIVGWTAAALTFCVLTWATTRGRDAAETAAMAARDDPSPTVTELLILMANLASLVAVAYVLVRASSAHGARQAVLAALAVLSVASSWALVHALYMLRYAVLYYSGTVGGIDFNQDELPRFMDFAYMAFTIGMTYQVSDTTLRSSQIRLAAFRHGLQAFVFGSMILATMVNLVAGLAR